MFEYIKGNIAELTPAYAVADVQGVGYFIRITLHTYSQLQGKASAKLFVEYVVRDDGHFLYGFAGKDERQFFRYLTSISGIGAASALSILSALNPEELARAIVEENVTLLKSVKGIGPKTAKRIIVELKDKIVKEGLGSGTVPAGQPAGAQAGEAVAALEVLGYPRRVTERVVMQIVKENPAAKTEEIIKQALKRL
ncbi:MAG: Holliday junction branch migration protein RuvA [Chlorobi bacterium]|nr:Holliday junction branch migration protein RuvA [Chlorobiota bacterium]